MGRQGAEEQGRRGAGGQRSRGAREQGSRKRAPLLPGSPTPLLSWLVLLVAILAIVAVSGCGRKPASEQVGEPGLSAPAEFRPGFIVETEELAEIMEQPNTSTGLSAGLVIVDARAADLYQEAHIPGAANIVNTGSGDIRDPDTAATGGFPITAEQAGKVFGAAGIDARARVIVYDAGDGRSASGVWFVLRFFGHDNAQVLNGGLRKWVEEGRPVTDELPKAEKKDFVANPRADLVVTSDWLLERKDNALLLDARSFDEYVGLNLLDNPRGGHIPGATWLEWKELGGKIEAGELETFKSPAEMQKVLQEKGIPKDREIVAYCQVGTLRGSFTYMALGMLGYENVRLYVGSIEDWSRKLDLPMETGK